MPYGLGDGSSVMSTPRFLQRLVRSLRVVGREEQRAADRTFREQLAHLRGCGLVHRGRTGLLQQDLAARVAGYAHGEPAHETEVDVGAHLEAELVDVEVDSFILVEDVDLGTADRVVHAATVRRRSVSLLLRNCSAAPKPSRSTTVRTTTARPSRPPRRNCVGVSPTIAANVRLNVPRLEKPTNMQMSVTLRSVVRRRYIARSMRRRCRYRCGVSPNVARNVRMKWALETSRDRGQRRHVERQGEVAVHRVARPQHPPVLVFD